MYNVTRVNGIKCIFDDTHVLIHKSYRISFDQIGLFCNELKLKTGLRHWRNLDSWVKTLTVNNWLYSKGIKRDSTMHTLLDDRESWLILIKYDILYALYKLTGANKHG